MHTNLSETSSTIFSRSRAPPRPFTRFSSGSTSSAPSMARSRRGTVSKVARGMPRPNEGEGDARGRECAGVRVFGGGRRQRRGGRAKRREGEVCFSPRRAGPSGRAHRPELCLNSMAYMFSSVSACAAARLERVFGYGVRRGEGRASALVQSRAEKHSLLLSPPTSLTLGLVVRRDRGRHRHDVLQLAAEGEWREGGVRRERDGGAPGVPNLAARSTRSVLSPSRRCPPSSPSLTSSAAPRCGRRRRRPWIPSPGRPSSRT